jgi:hypothetical protein
VLFRGAAILNVVAFALLATQLAAEQAWKVAPLTITSIWTIIGGTINT